MMVVRRRVFWWAYVVLPRRLLVFVWWREFARCSLKSMMGESVMRNKWEMVIRMIVRIRQMGRRKACHKFLYWWSRDHCMRARSM